VGTIHMQFTLVLLLRLKLILNLRILVEFRGVLRWFRII